MFQHEVRDAATATQPRPISTRKAKISSHDVAFQHEFRDAAMGKSTNGLQCSRSLSEADLDEARATTWR